MRTGTRKCLKICCIVTTIILSIIILLVVTLVILYFTIFKLKQPIVDATAFKLRHIQIGFFPIQTLQATLSTDIFIKNRNHAGLKYGNTSTLLYYRGDFVGEAPIPAGEIGARATENISTVIDLSAEKVISNPCFLPDVMSGMLNITSGCTVVGDAMLLKYIKLHAVLEVDCDITVFVKNATSNANCVSKIKI